MRILPHALQSSQSSFEPISQAIMLNGLITHGHPRALLGAILYGFAVWHSLQRTGTLGYGELIETLISRFSEWSAMPSIDLEAPGWLLAAEQSLGRPYADLWTTTGQECLSLLNECQSAMKRGALALDEPVLRALGAFDKKVNGSGTIAAASAIYLASRYAADPLNGLMSAAFADGADTDTIASMTGGLLGTLVSAQWPRHFVEALQDHEYISQMALRLIEQGTIIASLEDHTEFVSGSAIGQFEKALPSMATSQEVTLPDRRKAILESKEQLPTRVRNLAAFRWKLSVDDGQTIYVKKLERTGSSPAEQTAPPAQEKSRQAAPVLTPRVVGFRLYVSNLAESREFYTKSVGLQIVAQTETSVSLTGSLHLIAKAPPTQRSLQPINGVQGRFVIYIETNDLRQSYQNTHAFLLEPIRNSRTRRYFTCSDPDGNVVEIAERNGT